MKIVAITKLLKSDPGKQLKTHIEKPGKNGPLCGGGRDGSKNSSWQQNMGGISAVDCSYCLQLAVAISKKETRCARCGWRDESQHAPTDRTFVAPKLCSHCETPKERRRRYNKIKVYVH